MVTLILLSDASSLALEQPGSMVRGMSGRRLLIFFWKARRSRGCGYARPGTPSGSALPRPGRGRARAGAAVPRAAMNGRAGPWGPCVGPRSDTCGPCGIHADRRQAVERRGHRGPEAVRDPADDVSGRPPRDVQEAADRLPVRDAHQPCALRLGVAREPAARLGPRHHRDHGPTPGAVHSRHVVLLQCLFDRFGSVFPQCGLMVFPGVVIVSR